MEYTNIAADVGHYNCVLSVENDTALATEQNESVVLPNCIETQESRSETFVTPEMISQGSRKFTTKVSGRARHKERSELLTSSPYRDNLKQMVLKKTKRGKSSKNVSKPVRKIKTGKKRQHNRTDLGNWYCPICDDETMEDMIRCTACSVWVHTACAGVFLRTFSVVIVNCRPNWMMRLINF